MFHELDTVVLKSNIAKYDLKKGDIGSIVHIYDSGNALEIEFSTAEGKTIAVITLTPSDIRPMAKSEILHVRGIVSI
jgi:hypothetical protein